jgi:tRNA-2-methylthio-N6-dimethylallyladenosine synthase
MAKKYLIETFGCQMNEHDSERMAGLLDAAGYEATTEDADADVIVINTCSVREHAEDKLYTRLGELRVLQQTTGRDPVVAVAGCVAQQEGTALLRNANGRVIDLVLGTQRVKLLPTLLEQASRSAFPTIDVGPLDDVSFPLGLARRRDPVKAYVTIIEGCNDHCAFCVVPHTRGHERMRPRADILAEVREAVDGGRREVHLLGQIVNHYAAPDAPAYDFADLLADVDRVSGVERIRFASPHPRHTGPRLVAALRDLPRVCKHLHLPVQSGSTRVLAAMRRRHTREDYLDLVARLRAEVPGLTLSTDVIVGFPEETPADFEQTLSLVEAVRFHGMFSFKYSPRPYTLAARRLGDTVTPEEKTRRIVALQTLQRGIQTQLLQALCGTTVEVLVDSASRRRADELSGRSSGNTVVNFPRPSDTGGDGDDERSWIGRTVPVCITRAGPHGVWGRAVTATAGQGHGG